MPRSGLQCQMVAYTIQTTNLFHFHCFKLQNNKLVSLSRFYFYATLKSWWKSSDDKLLWTSHKFRTGNVAKVTTSKQKSFFEAKIWDSHKELLSFKVFVCLFFNPCFQGKKQTLFYQFQHFQQFQRGQPSWVKHVFRKGGFS